MLNPDMQVSDHTVRASATLTGTYVAGTVFTMDRQNAIGLEVNYTKGDETSMELKIEISHDDGTTYAQEVSESTTGGETTVTLHNYTFEASGVYSLQVTPVRGQIIRVSVKADGGTPTGTAALKARTYWV